MKDALGVINSKKLGERKPWGINPVQAPFWRGAPKRRRRKK